LFQNSKMKQIILLTITLLTSNLIQAQANGKLAFSAFFSPDYSYRTLSSSDSLNNLYKDIKDNHEKALYAYTSGINVSRKLFSIFAIETGLNYNKRGYVFDSASTTGNYTINQSYIYNYLQIPVRLKIFIPKGRYNFYITGGVSGMMLVDALKSSTETKNGLPSVSQEKLTNAVVNRFNYNMLFGVGLDYRITKRFYLKVEPTFSKTLDSIRKDKLSTYLYSGGVNLGFLYVFKKAK